MNLKITVISIILFFFISPTQAQYSYYKFKKKNYASKQWYNISTHEAHYFSGSIGLCMMNYFGDLTPNENYIKNVFRTARPGISASLNYKFNQRIDLTSELLYGRLIGDDFNASATNNTSTRKYVRNLSFRNDLVGLSILGKIYLFRDPFEYYKRRAFNLYLHTGITALYSNPKAKVPINDLNGNPFENAGTWVALRPLGTEGQNNTAVGSKKYSPILWALPVGGGLSYRIGHRIDLSAQATIQYVFSDYIDDVGASYVDLGALDNELARALSDRSMEAVAVLKNQQRDQQLIEASTKPYAYESAYDGKTYHVYQGYGHQDAKRGGPKNDIFIVTSFKISYIFTN